MRTKIAVFALLGASLLFIPLAHRAAEAASAPGLAGAVGSGTPDASLVLVRSGGGGGGGHFGGGGGGMGHMGGGMGHIGGGGMGRIGGMGHVGHLGGSPAFSGVHPHAQSFAGGGGGYPGSYAVHPHGGPRYANRSFDYNGPGGRYAEHHGNRYDHRHYAENGHDHNHYYRHRVYRNGAWVWVYGPGYYYGPDYYAYGGECYWLRQQAYATGSPYWWSRYNACLGYY
jgi:hypothetical protein